MSILKKPYELSVWVDEWDTGQNKFVEKRLVVIGTDKMVGQLRAIEPNLSRNVNGTKKLTFRMYKQYVDTATGEKVDNPFCQFLVNERKVKLKYDGAWYDFIVKHVAESSSGKICNYQLEDALVQELTKNGFNKTLDAELMNNIGTVEELANYVLNETDWNVQSETFVQTIEEPLAYVTIPAGTKITKLKNSHDNYLQIGLIEEEITLNNSITAMAFYSSCRNKPHRFQFIYTANPIETDAEQRIINKDSQYFIEVVEDGYGEPETSFGFILPKGVFLTEVIGDEKISTKYRGNRYGFAQKSKYSPLLKRYVNEYKKGGQTYYGYVESEYHSPILTTNLVSNTEFKNTSGWTGATTKEDGKRATVQNLYGYFDGDKFVSAIEALKTDKISECKAYLQLDFTEAGQIVLNSGPYDNRTLIGNMPVGTEWILKTTFKNTNKGTGTLSFAVAEYNYNTTGGHYTEKESGITFEKKGNSYTVRTNPYTSEESFKKDSKLKIAITASKTGTYYIEDLSFFRAKYNGTKLIEPDDQNLENLTEGTVTKTYYYFAPEELEKSSVEDIKYDLVSDKLSANYKRVYNTNGEKINTVTAKESNYFNILQSIAETFECWLELKVDREDDGAIKSKTALFKNYAGGDNYAAFRYGVNLVDVQRTFESRNIVTKLIVKQNSNDLADGGFCTIARATSNETGENYIYNFSYYQNNGLMSATDYVNTLYKLDGANGKDINENHTKYNLNGYFPRLRAINDKIIIENEKLSGIAIELLKYKANFDVSDAAHAAAVSGIQEVTDDLLALTKKGSIKEVLDLTEKSTEVEKYLQEYATYKQIEIQEGTNKTHWESKKNKKQKEYDDLWKTLEKYYEQKEALNKLFYERYSRFIQEGTWISEDYVDDEKYYIDAKSVMYNSCFPQVAYTINTLSISQLPGYEMFNFGLGDKTYVEDGEFFGYDDNGIPKREEVIIAEMVENLDDPSKNTNKVQNFKNQFQDLFQKITATTQQAQYNSGTYAQGAALAKAIDENKSEFLNEALDGMTVNLTGNPVLESTSADGSSAVKIIDGKVLFGTESEEGEKTWTVGMSSKGISANKITAGQLNTGEIQIMSGSDPTFRWDDKGISAYDYAIENNVISAINTNKFVRFDKYGLYGINKLQNGEVYRPENMADIDSNSTFALTWEGLKVTGNNNVVAKIGKQNNSILVVNDGTKDTFKINNDGDVEITGVINATAGNIGGLSIGDIEKTSSNVSQIVGAVGNDKGEVTAASITSAINGDTSQISINANKINFKGDDYIIDAKNINLKGQVTFESFDEETRKQIEADTIDVQIWSTRGNIFKSGDTTTRLECHVFRGGKEITDILDASAFTWEKYNNDGSKDTGWVASLYYGNHLKVIEITPNAVQSRAIFKCIVEV